MQRSTVACKSRVEFIFLVAIYGHPIHLYFDFSSLFRLGVLKLGQNGVGVISFAFVSMVATKSNHPNLSNKPETQIKIENKNKLKSFQIFFSTVHVRNLFGVVLTCSHFFSVLFILYFHFWSDQFLNFVFSFRMENI